MSHGNGSGTIVQLNASPGGVPKRAVAQAWVGREGLEGDRQAHTDIHGGPERALCLYSLERIHDLQAEGHPIVPGSVGENVTITGLDWDRVQPGARLALGDEVEVEVASFTSPCRTIGQAFRDNNSVRVSQKSHPGWSRVYARVLREGILRPGQAVRLLAPAAHEVPAAREGDAAWTPGRGLLG